MKFKLGLVLAIALSFSPATYAEEDCEPGMLSSFTGWVSSFVKKSPAPAKKPAGHQCPDRAVGKIAKDNSLGAKYLKEVANIGSFDRALQRDPQVKAFLASDQGIKRAVASDKNLRACVAQGPTLKYLLGLDAGVDEGYDIGEHTATVLNTYISQLKHYNLDLSAVSNRGTNRLLLPILALHDIGKGLAVKAGNKELQHHFTTQLVKSYLKSANFTQKEINLAVALIDHDTVGEYLKPGGISKTLARKKLAERAKMAGMSYGAFMKVQQLFYTSDAASYPFLRDLVFKKAPNGKLNIKSPKFAQLL